MNSERGDVFDQQIIKQFISGKHNASFKAGDLSWRDLFYKFFGDGVKADSKKMVLLKKSRCSLLFFKKTAADLFNS